MSWAVEQAGLQTGTETGIRVDAMLGWPRLATSLTCSRLQTSADKNGGATDVLSSGGAEIGCREFCNIITELTCQVGHWHIVYCVCVCVRVQTMGLRCAGLHESVCAVCVPV